MPTQAIKERLETLIPQIRRRQITSTGGGTARSFPAGALFLALAAGVAFSLADHARGLVTKFLDREVAGFKFDVFLTESADRPFVEERLLTTPGVRSVRFVPKEEALGRAQDHPALAESLKWVVRNPLPESFDVDWVPGFLLTGSVSAVAETWAELPGVLSTAYDPVRAERMVLLSRIAKEWDVVFSVLFWAGVTVCFLGVGRLVRRASARSLKTLMVSAGWGAVAGAAGAGVVAVWVGTWAGAGVMAGILVGALGSIGRDVSNG